MYMTPQACADAGLEYPSYQLFVGIDVGKSFHFAHAADAAGRKVLAGRVDNLEAAVDSFLERALGRSGAEPGLALVVVDQRRNVGLTALRRARAAGCEVAYITGKREKRARELFPGVAKTDAKDAEVIALAARGMPHALLPVPREDDGMEGARRLRSELAFAVKQATQLRNRLRAALVESSGAAERELDLSKGWCLGLLESVGGPWQMLDAGRAAVEAACGGADVGPLWEALSRATRPTPEQVRAEASAFPMLARRLRALESDVRELSALLAGECAGDEAYRCLLTVPGVGPATAAQLAASVDLRAFPDEAHLASYCGLAPRDSRSGTALSSASASREGNRALKNLLVFSCLSLVAGDSEFGEYYRRCRARGMRHGAALKATARKRLRVIWAVMRDRRPYSPPA